MRKLSLLAAIAAVLTLGSCSNDQEFDNTRTDAREIGFRSFIDKGGATRAAVTDATNMLGFTVTGWWDRTGKPGTPGNIADAPTHGDEYLFNAFDISRREAGIADWTYSPVRYWPAADIIGGGVTFFAYSPASSKNVSAGLYNYTGDVITYTVPDPVDNNKKAIEQEDFLLARTEAMDGSTSTVQLTFAHVLSRVKFYARTTNTNLTYVIGGVEMLGLAKTGDIDISKIPTNGKFTYADDNVATSQVTLWDNLSAKGAIGLDMGESPINLLGVGTDPSKYHSLHGDINALMVLPQKTELGLPKEPNPPVDGGFLIKVSYKAYLNNPTGTYFAGSETEYEDVYFQVIDKVRTVGATTIPFTFEIGRQYNFYLQFGSEAGDPITFDVGVGTWSDVPPVEL